MADGFKKLEIWQLANSLALKIYSLTSHFPASEQFSLTNQLRRAAVSVSANIAEGCGRYSKGEKIQFLIIARGSIYEVQSHLSIAVGLGYLKNKDFAKIEDEYEILIKRLNAFVAHFRKTN